MPNDLERRPINVAPYQKKDEPPDENFDNLLHNWNDLKDDIILFFGAGASVGAINESGEPMPGAYELRNQIWSRFILSESERKDFDYSNLALMSLEHVSTLAEIKSSRILLERYLSNKFAITKPLWQHGMIPFLKPSSIFTTNYDNLIELGYAATGMAHKILPVFNNSTSINPNKTPLYKPHGSINHPHSKVSEGGYVITQFDYYEIMQTRRLMLEKFMSNFHEKCVIFIGYSLLDFDISSILYNLNQGVNGQSWYAIFPRNDSDVRNMMRDKFGIRQINRTFFNFILELDQKVNFIPNEWKFKNYNKTLFQ
ncbi:SIR2 family NAD-dependent protein deacylase [Tellurirhabdus rosea]|uniref:SIR2 family NAD-dependent protein deacylase n=1 Tax=Tellurirhabdus rosea TaxID=2674997 RepID=UPI00225B170E|nr:SIR2 family protein [Tellurirhabdus rosea]